MYDFIFCFIMFLFYSFCGWIIEEVLCSFTEKKVVDRGFLIGPYCPIYGFAALGMIFLLKQYKNDLLALFILASVLCTLLEYLTSFIMEKLFHARWWDYSHKKFNINGRVCLINSLCFGILGCILVHFADPIVSNIVSLIPADTLIVIGTILLAIFILDIIVSVYVMVKFKLTTETFGKDNTDEISEEVSAKITEKLKEVLGKDSVLQRRIFNAFPNMTAILKDKKEKIENFIDEKEAKVKNSISETQEQVKQSISKTQNQVKKKVEESKLKLKDISSKNCKKNK